MAGPDGFRPQQPRDASGPADSAAQVRRAWGDRSGSQASPDADARLPMAIRADPAKGGAAPARGLTGNHASSPAPFNGKDVAQFAPNFTVYALPPDAVCLYSEDRKFFLHGELYCTLASAIGEGGRSFRELVRSLEHHFPSDKIHQALTRLVDRGYVVPASRSSTGTVAAYWSSLGLSPEIARRNLQNCRVRIESIDVEGATELGAALSGLGGRVVKRSP